MDGTGDLTRVSLPRMLGLTFFALAIGAASNTLEPSLLGHKVLELVPDLKNTALGLTTFAGLLVAILWQPVIGALSDRTGTRWGRRIPFLVFGTVMALIALFMVALAPVFGIILIGVLAYQLAANTVQAPWQALIPDQVPRWQRGVAAGLKAALEILAFVIGRSMGGFLVAEGHLLGAVALVAALYILALLVTILSARNDPGMNHDEERFTVHASLRHAFSVEWRKYPAFPWWFANRILFWGGFIALNTFLLFFLVDVVHFTEPDAQRLIANVSTILGLCLFVIALPSGWLADRIGRKPLLVLSGILAAGGTISILFVRVESSFFIIGAVLGLSVGIFLSANWALVTDIVPDFEAARYLGIANIATAGGSALARFAGGALIDPINRITGTSYAGYYALYITAAIGFLIGTAAIVRVTPVVETAEPPA
jgi:MFS family permease